VAASPRFRHLDEEGWQLVRQLKWGDEVLSVREKWLDFGPNFLSLVAQLDPGMMVQPAVTTATMSFS
jgi:hypothetical protein